MYIFMLTQMNQIEFQLTQHINQKDLRKPMKNYMPCILHMQRLIDNQLNTDFTFPHHMVKTSMIPGLILKSPLKNLIEFSTRQRNSPLENSLTLIIIQEERIECQREKDKDGLKIILISLEASLKRSNNTETTLKQILKKTLRTQRSKKCLMSSKSQEAVSSNLRDLILLRQVFQMNHMKIMTT